MEKHVLNPDTLSLPLGYSQLVTAAGGTTIHIAGQVAWDEQGALVGGDDFEAQARQVFSNLVAALAAAGATPNDLVKVGIYVVGHDGERLGIVRRVRDEILAADPPPASTLIGVESLALPDLLIEVDGVAVV